MDLFRFTLQGTNISNTKVGCYVSALKEVTMLDV